MCASGGDAQGAAMVEWRQGSDGLDVVEQTEEHDRMNAMENDGEWVFATSNVPRRGWMEQKMKRREEEEEEEKGAA
jgi:hypothetical protein